MPKRSSKPPSSDRNRAAFDVVAKATEVGPVGRKIREILKDYGSSGTLPMSPAPPNPAAEKNAAAVELGRLGGLKGGKARAAALTPEQRKETAQKAAEARWGKKP